MRFMQRIPIQRRPSAVWMMPLRMNEATLNRPEPHPADALAVLIQRWLGFTVPLLLADTVPATPGGIALAFVAQDARHAPRASTSADPHEPCSQPATPRCGERCA